MGDIVVIIATSIKKIGIICAAINITDMAPMYNKELTMLDTMLLASNKFLFILFCFLVSLRKKEKYQKKERIYSLFL